MPRPITALFFISLSYGLVSCSPSKNISGLYRSNFAILGNVTEAIRLKPDNTLEFTFSGDINYDSTAGQYQVYYKKLYITFSRETDKLYSGLNDMPLKSNIYFGDTIYYKMFYFIGHNKLYITNLQTGKKITRAIRENKMKKFIFFGSRSYNRKYYLKRVD
jgi:hypothetical protein